MSELSNKKMTKAGITYNSLHWWLRRNFGSANKCEKADCLRKSKYFVWALIKGKEYDRKRGNFFQLCRKCHIEYDMTAEWRRKFITEGRLLAQKTRIGMKHTESSKRKMSDSLKGRKVWNKGKSWSVETKKKMSLAKLGCIPWNKGLKTKI